MRFAPMLTEDNNEAFCGDGKEEYVISGTGIEQSEELVPLVVFSDNKNCDEGTTGTTTRVGFDNNDTEL